MREGRVSIPGKIINMLYTDDEFYREVSSSKKISIQNFPKHDQWSDEDGFHMEFALAGYSPSDISVKILGSVISVCGNKDENSTDKHHNISKDLDAAPPQLKISKGVIVRGIARRSFSADFFINHHYNLSNINACMKNGLLKITVPHVVSLEPQEIPVGEG